MAFVVAITCFLDVKSLKNKYKSIYKLYLLNNLLVYESIMDLWEGDA